MVLILFMMCVPCHDPVFEVGILASGKEHTSVGQVHAWTIELDKTLDVMMCEDMHNDQGSKIYNRL